MRDQNAIQAEIESLKREGLVKPEDVVAFAKNPTTALHGCFQWDDTEAAHQHRLQQARNVIRVYVVMDDVVEGDTVRAMVSLRGDRRQGGGYRAVVEVMEDADLHRQMLQDALKDLRTAQRRYAKLKELKPVFDAVEAAHVQFDLDHPKVA